MRSSLLSTLLLASSASALYLEPGEQVILPVQANSRVALGDLQTPRTVPPVTKGTLTNAPRADTAASMRETTWNPPKYLVADLDAVRSKTTQTYGQRMFMGTGFHQIVANKGTFNYCVRWDSASTANADTRAKINKSIQDQFKKWMDVLKGFQGWPHDEVKVNVVGWAARNTALVPGASDGTYKIYTDKDASGVPICDVKCSRARRPSNYKTACPDKGKHYDNELWLKDGLRGGKGNFNFHQVGKEYYLGEMAKGKKDIHIYLHEVGHTFALMDYYTWQPPTQKNFLMWAGSAEWITEFDAWQIRDNWRRIGPTLGFGGGASKGAASPTPKASSAQGKSAKSAKSPRRQVAQSAQVASVQGSTRAPVWAPAWAPVWAPVWAPQRASQTRRPQWPWSRSSQRGYRQRYGEAVNTKPNDQTVRVE